jgi:hypothetical protein
VRSQTIRHRVVILVLHVTAMPEHVRPAGTLLLHAAPMSLRPEIPGVVVPEADILGRDGGRQDAQ